MDPAVSGMDDIPWVWVKRYHCAPYILSTFLAVLISHPYNGLDQNLMATMHSIECAHSKNAVGVVSNVVQLTVRSHKKCLLTMRHLFAHGASLSNAPATTRL